MLVTNAQLKKLVTAMRLVGNSGKATKASSWNSLEVAKLLVSLLTPIAIAVATYQFNTIKDVEVQKQERLRRVVAKRVQIWDDIAPKMNDIYCYFLYVGRWKDLTPQDVLSRKRDLDSEMYANQILFSEEFFKSYQDFMVAAFETYRGWGKDAALRTQNIRPKDSTADKEAFTGQDNGDEVHKAYWRFQAMAANELDVPVLREPPRPAKPDGISSNSIKAPQSVKPQQGEGTITLRRTYAPPPSRQETLVMQEYFEAPGNILRVETLCASGNCAWMKGEPTFNGRSFRWKGEGVGVTSTIVLEFVIHYQK